MIPKIKKKISSFIDNEEGSISKKSLITAAVILSGISNHAKNALGYYPGAHSRRRKPGLDSGSRPYTCEETAHTFGPTTVGERVTQECHSSGSQSGCSSPQSHSNNIRGTHANTDRYFHRNLPDLSYDKPNKKIIGHHGHHGQHANHYFECSKTGRSHCNY